MKKYISVSHVGRLVDENLAEVEITRNLGHFAQQAPTSQNACSPNSEPEDEIHARCTRVLIRRGFLFASNAIGVFSFLLYLIFNYYRGVVYYKRGVATSQVPEADFADKKVTWFLDGDGNAEKIIQPSYRYSLNLEQPDAHYLHHDHQVLFAALLILEFLSATWYLGEYILRVVDNGRQEHWLRTQIAQQRRETFAEIRTGHYIFTMWGLIDLFCWLPQYAMLTVFAIQGILNKDHTIGRLGLEEVWVGYLYGFVTLRLLKFERTLYGFKVVWALARKYSQMYEYFLV